MRSTITIKDKDFSDSFALFQRSDICVNIARPHIYSHEK